MPPRTFTIEEANDALPLVRPLAEEMVAHHEALARLTARRAKLSAVIAGNGGGVQPRALEDLHRRLDEEAAGVARCVEEIQSLGALVKDLDRGLVDFPAVRDGETVLLCWQVGEDEIGFWHGADEGFAGRKPLPL